MLRDLTPRQYLISWTLAVLCGASRFLAMARSMWDWDEALFCLGMRQYDVTRHHPHPPGFPVYIGMAKVVRLIAPSDFRALQVVNLIAGLLVFPAIFLLARELRMRFETSIIAAVLFAFLPNVWFYGGTAFSDMPSIVLVVFAVVFLFRGRDSRRDYWLGTFLLALSIGIRPQNVLVGLFPGLLATMRRPWRDIVVAIVIGVIVVGVSFGAAIYATGSSHDYMTTVRAHGDYIARIDSFRAPERPPLWRLVDRFFLKQYQSPPLSVVISILVAISVVGAIAARDRAMLDNFLTFGLFAISAWLMLDRFSISRFSIGYAPMFAIFAADGIARISRDNRLIETGLGAALVAAFFIWTAPALPPVRHEVAPSVRAAEAAMHTRGHLFVGYSMTPFIEYLAPNVPITRVMDDRAVPLTLVDRPVLLAEVSEPQPGRTLFRRERGRLWNIARRHYFEVVLRPLTNFGQFGEGWSPPEQQGMDEWRWMGSHSVTTLPAAQGNIVLRLHFVVPAELLPKQPHITVSLNDKTLDSFRATEEYISRDYHVTAGQAGLPVLQLSTDQTVENRGLKVRFISWGPG